MNADQNVRRALKERLKRIDRQLDLLRRLRASVRKELDRTYKEVR